MARLVVAETKQGRLRGKRVTASGVNQYYSFQGIPYAKPPLGPLRFKPPEPPESWDGLKNATTEQEVAPCLHMFTQEYNGDEDCLFLNVYTPQWPPSDLKPVMFWIHGGGFMTGSGTTELFGPDYLVSEDIILVTINYRLGALGFLNLEGSDVVANNGLRDQVMALTWVKVNIAMFGGDPGNVTIFGQSAGGCSVHFLMLSPLAEGLFHRAIAQSGSALLATCFASQDVSDQRAHRLAKALGCNLEEPQQVADFLRAVPAKHLIVNQDKAFSEQENRRMFAMPFPPTTEKGSNKFFPDHPAKLLEKGKFAKVPLITGVTSAEGGVALVGSDLTRLVQSGKDFQNVVPLDLATVIDTDRSRQIASRLKEFYFGNKPLNENMLAEYVTMQSDLLFVHSMYTSAKHLVNHSDQPVYVYVFDHQTPSYLRLLPVPAKYPQGAYHGEDNLYLFHETFKPIDHLWKASEEKVRSHMVKIWTQFAKTGDLSSLPGNVSWPPVTKMNSVYLRIGETLNIETNMFKERIEFLNILYHTFKRVT